MLVIFCFICTWTLIIVGCWSSWDTWKEGVTTLKRLHQVPCSNCEFFTGDYRLKCTVHPKEALSEEAIACPDYSLSLRANIYHRDCLRLESCCGEGDRAITKL